jgi:hypothetical protein
MSSLSDHGLEVVKYPITQVRLQFHAGHWYVEYRRKPKFFLDKWWWFDDSKFMEYTDAIVRAQTLAAEGGTKEIKHLQTQIFNVNTGE